VDPPPPGPVRAAVEPADVGEAARQLTEPLARLESAVTAVRDHLETDPDKAREELEEAKSALDALRREVAVWSRR
jgi:hypothetical protein